MTGGTDVYKTPLRKTEQETAAHRRKKRQADI